MCNFQCKFQSLFFQLIVCVKSCCEICSRTSVSPLSQKPTIFRVLSGSYYWKIFSFFLYFLFFSFFFSILQKELSLSRRSSRVSHRKSFICTTSPTLPRCHSPISGVLFNMCQQSYLQGIKYKVVQIWPGLISM